MIRAIYKLILDITVVQSVANKFFNKIQEFKIHTSSILKPSNTVEVTTSTFPKNSTKSPTEFIAATRSTFEVIILNACCPELQKLSP